MNIGNFLSEFFSNKDSEIYSTAKSHIVDIKNKLNEMIVVFPDVTISEMVFMKNKWQKLPSTLGKGVSILGIDIDKDYKLLITKFSKNSYLEPHEHNSNFELNKVVSGMVYDTINNKTYNVGDVFIFEKNIKHNLTADSDAILLTIFSVDKERLVIPDGVYEKISEYC